MAWIRQSSEDKAQVYTRNQPPFSIVLDCEAKAKILTVQQHMLWEPLEDIERTSGADRPANLAVCVDEDFALGILHPPDAFAGIIGWIVLQDVCSAGTFVPLFVAPHPRRE